MSGFITEALIGDCVEGLSPHMCTDNYSASPSGALQIQSRRK